MMNFTTPEISFLISMYGNQSKGFKPFMIAASLIPSLGMIWMTSSVVSSSQNVPNKFPWAGFLIVLGFQIICYVVNQQLKKISKTKRNKLLLPVSFQLFFQISMLFFVISIFNLVLSILQILLNNYLFIRFSIGLFVIIPIVWLTGWIFARFRLHEFMHSSLYTTENSAIPKIVSLAGPISVSLVTAVILLRNANIEYGIYILLSVLFIFLSYFLTHYLGYHFRVVVSYIHFVYKQGDPELI